MIPASFDYDKPASLDEALALLAVHGDEARVLAGGQTLLTQLKTRTVTPRLVIDLSGIDDLRRVRREDGAVTIGALVTQAQVLDSEGLRRSFPIFDIDPAMLGDPVIRERGTVVGSLAAAHPAADWTAIALALDASIHVVSSSDTRTIPADQFLTGAGTTLLRADELITHVSIPVIDRPRAMAYQALRLATSDYARVGVAVVVEHVNHRDCTSCRIAITGLGQHATRARGAEAVLIDEGDTANAITDAADRAAEDVDGSGDSTIPPDYRAHLARVYTARALTAATTHP
ncbi:MAG: FAD binding domain-containing protein [Acidimicrobiales bacterium]